MGAKRITFATVLLCLSPLAVSAQDLPTGAWTGTITPPGGQTLDITYDVAADGDGFAIVVNGPPGPLPATDVVVAEDRVTFTFEPGTPVDCTLLLQDDGSYEGDCVDEDGDPGVLVMIPPDR